MRVSLALVAVGLATTLAMADFVVLPNYYETNHGSTHQNTIMRNAGNARSYQVIFDKSQLTNVPEGAIITGISYRIKNDYAPWPPEPGAWWDDYEIRIGTPATTVATMSRTFSQNLSGNEVLVQDGPYRVPNYYFVPGEVFPTASLNFQQPWVYPGGDVIVDIRHPGGLHADPYGYLEAAGTSDPGYGTNYRGLISTAFPPVTGNYTYGYVIRLEYIPEPVTLTLMLLAVPLLRRR